MRIDDHTANRGRLQADIETNVRSERSARPRAAFGRYQTDDAESGDSTAGACASNHERDAAWFKESYIREVRQRGRSFRALQYSEIRRGIAAPQDGWNYAAIRQRNLDLFVATERVLRGDDYPGPPQDAAGRTARFRVDRHRAAGRAFRDLRQSIRKLDEFCGHVLPSMNKMPQTPSRPHQPIDQVHLEKE
jgi:hypothetical protein